MQNFGVYIAINREISGEYYFGKMLFWLMMLSVGNSLCFSPPVTPKDDLKEGNLSCYYHDFMYP